ncbi:MAG: hypothetical protein OXG15_06965 [Gammaproteobacteria bacterium]|nr:hypothetical protein [Gammaproteobacteria bacterium]
MAEQWEELEEFDSGLIIQNDVSTQVYYHQQSRTYDFTLNGWTRLANENDISIVDLKSEDLEKSYRVTVVARRHIWHKESEQLIQIDRIGGHEESKMAFGKVDTFAYSKALSKAQRNGYKSHLKGHSSITQENLKKIFDEQQGKNGSPRPQQQTTKPTSQKSVPVPPGNAKPKEQSGNGKPKEQDYFTRKKKEMWATYNELKSILEGLGITQEVFKNGVYEWFGVESTTEMDAEQHLQVTKALRFTAPDGTQIAKRIRDWGSEDANLVDPDDVPFGDDEPLIPPPASAKEQLDARVMELSQLDIGEVKKMANKYITDWIKDGILKITVQKSAELAKDHFGVDMIHKTDFEVLDYALMVATFEQGEIPAWLAIGSDDE